MFLTIKSLAYRASGFRASDSGTSSYASVSFSTSVVAVEGTRKLKPGNVDAKDEEDLLRVLSEKDWLGTRRSPLLLGDSRILDRSCDLGSISKSCLVSEQDIEG